MEAPNLAKVSFKLGTKRKFIYEPPRPGIGNNGSEPHDERDHDPTHLEQASEGSKEGAKVKRAERISTTAVEATDLQSPTHTSGLISTKPVSARDSVHQPIGSVQNMAEPPAKRAKRTDSSAMWERNSSRPSDPDHRYSASKGTTNGRERRDEKDRYQGREDVKRRSRSRDRGEKRRDRSRSRDRDGGRYRKGERNRERDRRDRERSTSRERHRSRRGEQEVHSPTHTGFYTDPLQ